MNKKKWRLSKLILVETDKTYRNHCFHFHTTSNNSYSPHEIQAYFFRTLFAFLFFIFRRVPLSLSPYLCCCHLCDILTIVLLPFKNPDKKNYGCKQYLHTQNPFALRVTAKDSENGFLAFIRNNSKIYSDISNK